MIALLPCTMSPSTISEASCESLLRETEVLVVKPSSRRISALMSSAVIASSLAACGSDTPEAADSSDASTSTQLKGTAVKGVPTPLEVLMESGKPAGVDYRYTAEHMWVNRLPDGTLEVGLTNFAQEALGDIVYLEFPQLAPGSTITAGAPFGLVESTKTSSEILLPFGGVVTEINTGLIANPANINADPYASWLIKITPDNSAAFDSLGTIPT